MISGQYYVIRTDFYRWIIIFKEYKDHCYFFTYSVNMDSGNKYLSGFVSVIKEFRLATQEEIDRLNKAFDITTNYYSIF